MNETTPMIRSQRALLSGLLCVIAVIGSACNTRTTAPDINWGLFVAITSGGNAMTVGQTTQVEAFLLREGQSIPNTASQKVTQQVTWSVVGATGVISVSQAGVVTALAPGTVTLRAVFGNESRDMTFFVQ